MALANLLNDISSQGRAYVIEAEGIVTVSNLSIDDAREVLSLSSQLGWAEFAYDNSDESWRLPDLDPEYAPFRISIRKPATDDALYILTNSGFSSWLRQGHSSTIWRVASLSSSLITQGRVYSSWDGEVAVDEIQPVKSPRSLVREYGSLRAVPEDIRPWLLRSEGIANEAPAYIWANIALREILRSLCDEIDIESNALKFKGPPRLSLALSDVEIDFSTQENQAFFTSLQSAACWVYENEREAELRHILLSTEIARSGGSNSDAIECFSENISGALEGAKVAYQMSLSDLGRDTLKVLADLRKAITEETAKVTDATRQVVAAITGALAIGLGLIAARIGTSAAPWLLVSVMILVSLYVVAVIYSGFSFIGLQRQLRKDWQPRLYRFLPDSEYRKMVEMPAQTAEKTFRRTSVVGGLSVLIMTSVICFYPAPAPAPAAEPDKRQQKAETKRSQKKPAVDSLTPDKSVIGSPKTGTDSESLTVEAQIKDGLGGQGRQGQNKTALGGLPQELSFKAAELLQIP